MMWNGVTSIGSGEAPTTISVPSTPSPSISGVMALPLVTVARITLAPPSAVSALAASSASLSMIDMRAELERQPLLVLAAGDGDGVEAHAARELHAEMAEPANALNGHEVAGPAPELRSALKVVMPAQSSGAAAVGVELVGDRGERLDRRDHVVGIAAVIMDAGDFEVAAGDEIAAPAAVADKAHAAEPADADPLAGAPGGDVGPDGVDAAGDLVTRHRRIVDAGKRAGGDQGIAVADAAGLDLDAHLARPRLGDRPLDQLERGIGLGDLDDPHGTLLQNVIALSRRYGPRLRPLKIDCTAIAASSTPNTRTITLRAVTPIS